MIPTTLVSLLVVLLAVLPGIPGDQVYRSLAGVSWREKEHRHVLRLLSFSVLGLALYAAAAAEFGWHAPAYIVPVSYAPSVFTVDVLGPFSVAYLGHLAGAAIVGAGAAFARRGLSRVVTSSGNRDAWDHFVNLCVPGHWIIVRLKSGAAYAGMLDHADVSVEPEYRDIILAEPAEWDEAQNCYVSSTHQVLFLRGVDIVSIVTIFEPSRDNRVVAAGTTLFHGAHDARDKDTGSQAPHEADAGVDS